MVQDTLITVAHGDGIGPEIMAATLHILKEAGARIAIEEIEIGEKVYLRGNSAGIEPSAWESLRRTKVFLKAPITTPQGGGFKSLNVTTRKSLGLYANVRPCVSYHPFVRTKHPKMDVVIVRENEEDLYAGIEYQLSPNVMQTLKLISRPGSEKIVRYAFDYARQHNRKKVTCFTKDNIMKMSDGLFHKVFDEVAAEYKDIENEHWIVDIGAAKMADTPETFDVIVMPNLYGDVLSDVAAQIAGSVGLAGSSNIGSVCAMFEAIHGSAPRRAGQNLANPSGLLLGAVLMLVHINQVDAASRVHNAWLRTIEDGIHTYDIFLDGVSKQKVGTKELADAVVARIGQEPQTLKAVKYAEYKQTFKEPTFATAKSELVGVDVYTDTPDTNPNHAGELMAKANGGGLKLIMISNRGVKVWPDGMAETFCVDSFRCRYEGIQKPISPYQITALLDRLAALGVVVAKTEYLRTYDGKAGYTLAQGNEQMELKPLVGVIMGSKSDWETMQHAAAVLKDFAVPHECRIVSAHRTPDLLATYSKLAAERGLEVMIAGAGGAAHLPGMLAAYTPVPVLGVPVETHALKGMDSLLSIVQMPRGIPVATFAIGHAGAMNAALMAVAILANTRPALRAHLIHFREAQTERVLGEKLP